MSVRYHLLILLISVLSLCGATEYYVRPTESTNISCPAQPCLTLSQYITDSGHYFKSNTVFKFLPGTHHMDQPLLIGNVHNMSLENFDISNSEQPHLVAQFSFRSSLGGGDAPGEWFIDIRFESDRLRAVSGAAIKIHDSRNVTLRGINITTQSPGMSGIIVAYVSSLKIHLVTASASTSSGQYHISLDMQQIGILITEASMVEVHSSSTANYSCGFAFQYTSNTLITNVMATYSSYYGIALCSATNTTVISPKAKNNHGGMVLFYDTNTTIIDAITVHSGAIGMYLTFIADATVINPTAMFNGKGGIIMVQPRETKIINATVMHNAYSGISMSEAINVCIVNASIHVTQNDDVSMIMGYISISSSSHTRIFNSSFTGFGSALNAVSATDPSTHPAVIVLYDSSLYVSGCNFTGNSICAVKAYASNITAAGHLIFSSNRALAGTAFILVQNSILRVTENASVYFRNNHAINIGGVFYVSNNVYYSRKSYIFPIVGHPLLQSTCFLNVMGWRSHVKLTFVNNSAGEGGDILYGGHVALGVDGDKNCIEKFKKVSNISQSGLSLITSDPSRVCLCNETGQLDCLTLVDPTPHSIYPGQSFNISAVVVGQQFGTVCGSVYAQFLQGSADDLSPQLATWQGSQSVMQEKCNTLTYTIFSGNEESNAVLALTATNKEIMQFSINASFSKHQIGDVRSFFNIHNSREMYPIMYSSNTVYIKISILPCPLGFMLTTERPFKCECNKLLLSLSGVTCHIDDQTIGRSGLVWVGTLQNCNGTVVASEQCSSDYCNGGKINVKLTEPDSQCNYDRSGTLCGGCQPGLSLALGSAQCLQCSNKYLALLIPFALAGPAVVFFIKLLDLTLSQGTINGLIFYANIVKANQYMFSLQEHMNPLTLFISWLNLDLGVETCFFHGLTAYSKTWLQFVFPIYIWSIAGLIIILAKYSDHVAKMMGNNSVPVLATLFLLSYAKLLRTIITALSYAVLYSSHGHKAVWSADGNVDYLGSKHAPLFAVALAVLIFLWLPYTLLLFFGQWLYICNCRLIDHILMKMKPFLDAHYGPLKGKHRYWFGTLLLVRTAILLISTLIPANYSVIVSFCVSVSAAVLIFWGMTVYRSIMVAMYDVFFIMNLLLLNVTNLFTTIVKGDEAAAAYILVGVAFIQFLGLILYKMFFICKRSEKVMACLRRRQPVEDDWELYEEASLQRQVESDTEEEDSGKSESLESLPTY